MNARVRAQRLGCALALLGLAGCSARPKNEPCEGPFLSITLRDGGTAPHRPVLPGAVALALGGLPAGEAQRLGESLADSTDAAVRRAAPILFDAFEGDAAPEPAPFRRVLPDLPALTAAANLAGAPWEAPGISVELRATCTAASAAARCVPLHAASAGPEDVLSRRARALAWSLTSAAVVRVPAQSRPALLRALYAAQLRPASTIALVFSAPRGTLEPAAFGPLRHQARRALAHLDPSTPARGWLEALASAPSEWELPIRLAPDEVLVVPRLSAQARPREFAAELLAAGASQWTVRPRLR